MLPVCSIVYGIIMLHKLFFRCSRLAVRCQVMNHDT